MRSISIMCMLPTVSVLLPVAAPGPHCQRPPRHRRIQVADADGDHPRFGLVDFGLAVDADAWQGSNESGGDGRYWPFLGTVRVADPWLGVSGGLPSAT